MSKHEAQPQKRARRSRKAVEPSNRWDKAAPRMLALLRSEFTLVKPDILGRRVEVNGVAPDILSRHDGADQLHRAVALSICLNKDEVLIKDICPTPGGGGLCARQVNDAARRVRDHVHQALRECDREAAAIRLSRSGDRFDLRVYIGDCPPTVGADEGPHGLDDR